MRKELKHYIDDIDERMLRVVYAILEADKKTDERFSLIPEQDAELDEIMALDKQGLMKYSSWDEVKVRITSKKGR